MAALSSFIERIAILAIEGRGWMPQAFSNDHLKAGGGPGSCLRNIRETMEAAGLIEVRKGYFDKELRQGRVTRVRASLKLRALMVVHGLPVGRTTEPVTTSILRPTTTAMPNTVREQDRTVKAFNRFASERRIGWADHVIAREVYLVRLFKGDWSKGGRLYGGFWQELSKAERANLRIDGEEVVELDFRSMQPRILFALKGLPLDFDPYVIPGFSLNRKTGKLAYNRLVNRKGTAANRKCPINFSKDFRTHFADQDQFRAFVAAMEDRLSPVTDCFGKQPWGILQREESELMLSILSQCMAQGVAAYPIHDSLLVRRSDAIVAAGIMLSAFRNRYGVEAIVN